MNPIPWRDIVFYAEVKDLAPDVFLGFHQVIREMDQGYMHFVAKEMERKRKERDRKRGKGEDE